MKLLIDTDLGSDIDDALALAYALARPEVDLVGVTTVGSEPQRRAGLVDALSRSMGGCCEVASGAAEPLRVAARCEPLAMAAALERWSHETPERGGAVALMRKVFNRWPGEVTLLAIGPLTNVARLFEAEPTAARRIRQLVWMGGDYADGAAEWNAAGDPEAAAHVLNAPIPSVRLVGFDVTRTVHLPSSQVARRVRAAGWPMVAELVDCWTQTSTRTTFHDPLAAIAALDGLPMCWRQGAGVDVTCGPREDVGRTRLLAPQADDDASGPGRVEVAEPVDAEAVLSHYFEKIEQFAAAAHAH